MKNSIFLLPCALLVFACPSPEKKNAVVSESVEKPVLQGRKKYWSR
jgi:hypothetical protein